jgi:hypothetical protein
MLLCHPLASNSKQPPLQKSPGKSPGKKADAAAAAAPAELDVVSGAVWLIFTACVWYLNKINTSSNLCLTAGA